MLQNIPRYLYHGTFGEFLDDIMSEGLIPTTTTTKLWPEASSNYVYLADTAGRARRWPALFEGDVRNGNIPYDLDWLTDNSHQVVKIDTRGLNPDLFSIDPNMSRNDFRYRGIISPEHLTIIDLEEESDEPEYWQTIEFLTDDADDDNNIHHRDKWKLRR